MICPTCGAVDQRGRYCRACGGVLPPAPPDDASGAASPRSAGWHVAPVAGGQPTWRAAALPGRQTAPRSPWGRRLAVGSLGCATLVVTACVVFLVVASVPDPAALGLSVAAAVVPASIYSFLVLRLDRYEAEPTRLLLGAFGWGAIGAIFFSIVVGLVFQALLQTAVNPDAGSALSAVIGAPLIEETFKGVAVLAILLVVRHELDNALDGLVYGALVGLGFAMTENVLYFGAEYLNEGFDDLGRLFIARAVIGGFGHAAYTGTFGAAIGWARSQYRRGVWRFVVPLIGWALAVIQHMLWNGGAVVIAALQGDDANVITVVLIEGLLFIVPAVAVLLVIARIASRRELAVIREQLADEVTRGVLTPADHAMLGDPALRRAAAATARRDGPERRRQHHRFVQVAAELAFRKHHLSRGEPLKPGQHAPEDAYRTELVALRRE